VKQHLSFIVQVLPPELTPYGKPYNVKLLDRAYAEAETAIPLCNHSNPAQGADDLSQSHAASNRFGALQKSDDTLPGIAVFFVAAQRSG
jgi:hypothetical protein